MALLEVDHNTIKEQGSSLYLLLPLSIRRSAGLAAGDTVRFLRSPDNDDIVLRIEKAPDEHVN